MKYGIYNDELGYGFGPEYDNAFEAVIAAWGKCRSHHVVIFDDDGKFLRNMTSDQEVDVYEEGRVKFPANKIYYIFHARTPLADDQNSASNWRNIQPFKELAIQNGIQFGGLNSVIGSLYMNIPGYIDGGGFGIGVLIDYAMEPELRKKFDLLARKMACPAVMEYNKYDVRLSLKSYSK